MLQQFKKRKKTIAILAVILIFLIIIIFFLKNNDKNLKIGNTKSNKSIEDIEEYILNLSSYEATVAVTVISNKNENKYVLSQKYVAPNISKQIVLEPENIAGLETTYDGNNLTIYNAKFNLSKIYENYESFTNNDLSLEAFIADYRQNKEDNSNKCYEENNEFVLECTSKKGNDYRQNKKLYVKKETGNPCKIVIQDVNEKNVVYILYNEITINSIRENDILAFKTIETEAELY